MNDTELKIYEGAHFIWDFALANIDLTGATIYIDVADRYAGTNLAAWQSGGGSPEISITSAVDGEGTLTVAQTDVDALDFDRAVYSMFVDISGTIYPVGRGDVVYFRKAPRT